MTDWEDRLETARWEATKLPPELALAEMRRLRRMQAFEREFESQQARPSMVLNGGPVFKPLPLPQPLTPWRHELLPQFNGLRFLWWLIKTTATVSWDGHQTIVGWLEDSDERSRADGLRVLASVGYAILWAFTIGMAIVGIAVVVAS